MNRKFLPALVYHRGAGKSDDYGESAPSYSGEPMPIDIAISVIGGAFTVQNDIRAIRSTHVGLTSVPNAEDLRSHFLRGHVVLD